MTIVLKTSSTASMQRVCVLHDTPGLRGSADDHRAQDLEHCEHAAPVCLRTARVRLGGQEFRGHHRGRWRMYRGRWLSHTATKLRSRPEANRSPGSRLTVAQLPGGAALA